MKNNANAELLIKGYQWFAKNNYLYFVHIINCSSDVDDGETLLWTEKTISIYV